MTSFGDKLEQLFPLILKEDNTARRVSPDEIKNLSRKALLLMEPVTMNPYDISDVRREMETYIYNYEMNYDEDFKKKVDEFIIRKTQTAGTKRRKSKKKKRTKRKLK